LPPVEKLISEYPKISEISKTYSISELNPDIKWKSYYQSQNSDRFKNLVPFSTYAKVVRGIATGANDYFTFNISKAKEFNIDERFLLPCICHATDVRGNLFTNSDLAELIKRDKRAFLINALNANNDSVVEYIIRGEQEKVNTRNLTSNRNPWYSLEKRPPAPIWVSVFNRTGLRFVRNEANAMNLTTFHCVYPKLNMFSDISIDLLFAYLLTDTSRRIFEDNGREYGNGLQKFEPNDLNKGKILDLDTLSSDNKRLIEKLYGEYVGSNDYKFIDRIDKLLVENFSFA
jgi:adenine-specific DNA-methyltransferase